MALSEHPDDRQFHVDSVTSQTFFREHANGVWSTWRPLEPSDFHPPRPAAHNVISSNPQDPVVALDPSLRQLAPPPSTQPSLKVPGWGVSASPPPPSQSQRDLRRAGRNDRAHGPVRTERSQHRRGRTRGAPNYRPREVEMLLDLVDEELPVGAKGWNVIGARFREWAAATEHPARADRSLEIKFKQLVKTKKPTGDAYCPPEITRAHIIDDRIQGKVACRDLGDDDIMDFDGSSDIDNDHPMSDPGEEPIVRPARAQHRRARTVRVEAPLPSRNVTRQSSSKGLDFLDRITKSIDPEQQAQRDSDRASTIFQAQQLLLLQSQIRDLNQSVLSLRTQLNDSERRRAHADRRADRLQNQIDITSAVTRARLYRSTEIPTSHQNPISISSSSSSASTPDHNWRWEATFNDGGRCSWVGGVERLPFGDDVVEVTRVPWSPPPHSPPQSVASGLEEATL